MFTIGPNELLMILLLILLLFGASRVPEVARNMGKAIGEFRKGQVEAEMEIKELEEKLKEEKEKEKVEVRR